MIRPEQIENYFPLYLRKNPVFQKYMIKEYIQLIILDYLASTNWIYKLTFIGGTNLRLIKGIDRFSEDIDFDCKDFSKDEFLAMTDDVLHYLTRFGFKVEDRSASGKKLAAFRRNIYFPAFLYDLGLSAHKDERFLIKIECQDQQITYPVVQSAIKGCGYYFSFPAPNEQVLCAMKISALLSRSKGRDFYDVMFLLGQTSPDYTFLSERCEINNLPELKSAFLTLLKQIDLTQKARDFEHLLFEKRFSSKILSFKQFIEGL